jgi:hypothetical protein
VLDWYDNIYLPLVKVIHENSILKEFPGRTAGDLYLWIMDHRWDIGPQTAALSYNEHHASWTRKVLRFLHRLNAATTGPLVVSAKRIARALKASIEDAA